MEKVKIEDLAVGESYILDYEEEGLPMVEENSIGFRHKIRRHQVILKILKIESPFFAFQSNEMSKNFARLDNDGIVFYKPSKEFVKAIKYRERDRY